MNENRYVVIMAGGRGERFWPQSRLRRPKHLLPIVGNKPMLTQTIERLGKLVPPERVLVITNKEQRESVIEVLSVPLQPALPTELFEAVRALRFRTSTTRRRLDSRCPALAG